VDIMDGAALKAWIASAGDELGGIDMLVSNAGAMAQGGDPASWEQNFRLDVLGAVNALEASLPFLEASGARTGDASVIILSSISAAVAENTSSYGPIKAALVHMAKGFARQYAARNIRVNAVSPGTIYTAFHSRYSSAEKLAATAKTIPMQRLGTAEDCAGTFLYLLASDLSSYVTGQVIEVNGGQLMP